MLSVSTQQNATVHYKAACCRPVYKGMLQFCTLNCATRQYTRVCYRPDKMYATDLYTTVCYSSVKSSTLQVNKQQYATRQYTRVCYKLEKKYATDLYTAVCYCSVRCSTLRLNEPTSFHNHLDSLHSLLHFSLIVRSTSLKTF